MALMGMSTHVVGIKPPDDRWHRMKEVWDACKRAGITPPDSVMRFFEDADPDEKGVIISLTGTNHSSVQEWNGKYAEGFEVYIKQLPPDVTIVRFYNSW